MSEFLWTVSAAVATAALVTFGIVGMRGATAADARPEPDIRAVVFHAPGPKWTPGIPFRQQSGVQAHVEHFRKLNVEKKLFLGGPFLDDTGGMMIAAEGVSPEELRAFAAEDPAVKSGLLTATVKPWMIGMKGP